MTQQEKSIKLLKMMGWHPVKMPKYHSEGWYRLADANGQWDPVQSAVEDPDDVWENAPNLYNLKYMVLAWEVLNWVVTDSPFSLEFTGYWENADVWQDAPEVAQERWLDAVLRLAEETT